jgi:flagellin-like hook-associated protein FlgL
MWLWLIHSDGLCGTKAGIKGGSVAMGYLETGMRVLDSASGLLSRLQELAVLGANNTNTRQLITKQ